MLGAKDKAPEPPVEPAKKPNGEARPRVLPLAQRVDFAYGEHEVVTAVLWVANGTSTADQQRLLFWGPVTNLLAHNPQRPPREARIVTETRDRTRRWEWLVRRVYPVGCDVALLHEWKFEPLPEREVASLIPDGYRYRRTPDLGFVLERLDREGLWQVLTDQQRAPELNSELRCVNELSKIAAVASR